MGGTWSRGGRAGAALVSCLSGVMLTACGGAGGTAGGSVSAGSCAAWTASAYLARARVVFVGTALPGSHAVCNLDLRRLMPDERTGR